MNKKVKKVLITSASLLMMIGIGSGISNIADAKTVVPLNEMDTHASLNKVYKDASDSEIKFDDVSNEKDYRYFLTHDGRFMKYYKNRTQNNLYKSNVISDLADNLSGSFTDNNGNIRSNKKNGFNNKRKNQDIRILKHGLKTRREKDFFNLLLFKDARDIQPDVYKSNGEVKWEVPGGHIYKLSKRFVNNFKHMRKHNIRTNNIIANKVKHRVNFHSYQFKLGIKFSKKLNEIDPYDASFDNSLGKHLANKVFKAGFLYNEIKGNEYKNVYHPSVKNVNLYEKLGKSNKAFHDGWSYGVLDHKSDAKQSLVHHHNHAYRYNFHLGYLAGHNAKD